MDNKKNIMVYIQTGILAGILVILIIVGVLFMNGYRAITNTLNTIETEVKNVDVNQLNDAIASLKEAASSLQKIDVEGLNQTAQSLEKAADNLAQLDMKEVNDAVIALSNAADNLADMDVDSLNALVNSLETVSTKLQSAVNGITGIFGR